MRTTEREYYVYDKKNKEFITADGKFAVIGESFKREMLNMNSSFLIFIDKVKYNNHKKESSLFVTMGKDD